MSTPRPHRVRYFGVFDDYGNYARSSIHEREDVIQIPRLEDAVDLLRTLQHSDDPSWLMQSGVRTLNDKGLLLMPGVTEDASITLYPVPEILQRAENRLVAWEESYGPSGFITEPYPSHVVRVGARGGVIVEEVS